MCGGSSGRGWMLCLPRHPWPSPIGGRMRAQRYKRGSVRFDKRRGTWNYLFYDNGTRRSKLIGTKQEYPTKAAAWKAAEKINHCTHTEVQTSGPLFAEVIA